MSIRVASVLALSLLLSCASRSSMMNVRDMSDDALVEHYQQIEAEIAAITKELDEAAKTTGRVIPFARKQDRLNSLKKRRATVLIELRRRDIRVEPQ